MFGIGSALPVLAQPLEQGIYVGQAPKPAGKGASLHASAADNTVTQDGIALTLSDVKFNGEEVSLKLSQHAPKGTKEIADLTRLVDGETGPFSISYGFVAGSKSDVTVRFGHTGYDHRTKQAYQFPDKFEFTLQVKLDGMEKKPYEFRIPVSKNVSDRILTPKMAKTHKGLELSLKKAVVSAGAIKLDIGARAKGKLEAWEDILKNQAGKMWVTDFRASGMR